MADKSEKKGLVLGVVVAAAALAVGVFFLRGEPKPAPSQREPEVAPVAAPEPPPVEVEGDRVDPPIPGNLHVLARAKVQRCPKQGECAPAAPAAARISVMDPMGEVAGYDVGPEDTADIRVPSGRFVLMAKDKDGFTSKPHSLVVPHTGTTTLSIDLTIVRKAP